jgi:hypothetical protein
MPLPLSQSCAWDQLIGAVFVHAFTSPKKQTYTNNPSWRSIEPEHYRTRRLFLPRHSHRSPLQYTWCLSSSTFWSFGLWVFPILGPQVYRTVLLRHLSFPRTTFSNVCDRSQSSLNCLTLIYCRSSLSSTVASVLTPAGEEQVPAARNSG